jgi:hypothetical protein
MTLSITLIGGPTALVEIDGFRMLGAFPPKARRTCAHRSIRSASAKG